MFYGIQPINTNIMNIAIFFGSRTTEHDVSITSAYATMKALEKNSDYVLYPIYIDKDGKRYYHPDFVKLETFSQDVTKFAKTVSVDFATTGKLKCNIGSGLFWTKQIIIDVVFPVLHGHNGEDGSLMWLCNLLNVPYVAPDVIPSGVWMDKIIFKKLCETTTLPITKWLSYNCSAIDKEEIIRTIWYPCIVKPNSLGSSIGVSKVHNEKELENALELVLCYDQYVIIEECITELIECNCSVRFDKHDIIVSEVEKIATSADLLDFSEKYINDGGSMAGVKSKVQIPAPIDNILYKEIQSMTRKVAAMIHCTTWAPRIDFLIKSATNEVYVNEINTIPWALQMHLWNASGLTPVELVTSMIQQACRYHDQKNTVEHQFQSAILQHTLSFGLPVK